VEPYPAVASEPAPSPLTAHHFRFTGTGSEYFRIWSVNLLLTLLTLGLYSPWAKVRREKFFHQQLILAEASFDYHANPWTILRGRVIAFILLVLTQTEWLGGGIAIAATALLYVLLPWMLRNSLRFRLANTSYRGIRFGFDGTTKETYRLFFALTGPALILFACAFGLASWIGIEEDEVQSFGESLGLAIAIGLGVIPFLLMPYAHGLWRRFLTNHSRFGDLPFAANFSAKQTALVYFGGGGRIVIGVIAAGLLGWGLTLISTTLGGIVAIAAVFLVYAALLLFGPYLVARLQNLWWPLTQLGNHHFDSDLQVAGYVRLQVRNFFLMGITLGLYRPFAVVNNMHMRAQAMSLHMTGSLDDVMQNFTGGDQRAVGAEAADLVGFDFSL
jgi:uncharacterized membrane protein YjgN (DUF898 family)